MYPPNLTDLSAREVAAALEAKGLYQVKIISSPPHKDYPSLLQVEYSNGDLLHYFTEKEEIEFSEKWGACNCPVYRAHVSTGFQYESWDFDLSDLLDNDRMVFEFKIRERNSSLFNFYNTIMQPEKDRWKKITQRIQGHKIAITYQDIYLKDALGCLILLNLIKSFRDKYDLKIQSLNFHLSAYNNPYFGAIIPSIDKDWGDSHLRTSFLKQASKSILGLSPGVNEDRFLPHWRELVFTCSDFELVIRPNGGIRNGWKLDSSQAPIDQTDLDFSKDIKLFNQSHLDGILFNIVFENKVKP
jgi:hypothetical protein